MARTTKPGLRRSRVDKRTVKPSGMSRESLAQETARAVRLRHEIVTAVARLSLLANVVRACPYTEKLSIASLLLKLSIWGPGFTLTDSCVLESRVQCFQESCR